MKKGNAKIVSVIILLVFSIFTLALSNQYSKKQTKETLAEISKIAPKGEIKTYRFYSSDKDLVNDILEVAENSNKEIEDISIKTRRKTKKVRVIVKVKQK